MDVWMNKGILGM